MKQNWDAAKASEWEGELGQLAYATRLLGREESVGLYGGGNASLKLTMKNLLGEEYECLCINHGLQPPQTIDIHGFTPLRGKPLASLVRLDALTAAQLTNELACNRTLADAPPPPSDAVLHAVLPYRCVFTAQPDAVLAVADTPGGPSRLREIYGELLLIVPYAPAGLALAKACAEVLRNKATGQVAGIFMMGHGLATFGDTVRLAYERMVDLVTRAEQYLERHDASAIAPPEVAEADQPQRQDLAALRKAVSAVAGCPLLLSVQADPVSLGFCRRPDLPALVQQGPAAAGHAALTRHLPMIGRNVEAYSAAYEQTLSQRTTWKRLPNRNSAPRIVLDPHFGLCALGCTAGQALLAGKIYRHTIDIILRATALEKYQSLPPADFLEAESWAYATAVSRSPGEAALFAGEIALVTGGASGIGKACVQSLLARGAAVVSLDVNPAVTTLWDRPDYLGLQCDLTDETATVRSYETLARKFGGLDMLVVNAGIFPAGCRIESLTLAEWQRVMRINLDSNLGVMREAYPLLKNSPRGGRVLVNASKNVLAPAPGRQPTPPPRPR